MWTRFYNLTASLFLKCIDFLQRGRERDRELETSMREKHRSALPPAHPALGMCPQPRYMPLTRIEPGTFQSADRRSTTEPNWFRADKVLTKILQLSTRLQSKHIHVAMRFNTWKTARLNCRL
uniref:Uncharacterized protein n=1 Tax=Pipistrellus kuhlii TaxID=59472 RepID=A0A7J7TW32_PIPKU|nr:hypothetical protein mPipKuh1_009247 [Pipistrellus kuhlii]